MTKRVAMTLKRQLFVRYLFVALYCLTLLLGLAHHEFITEPRERAELGIREPPETMLADYTVVIFFGMTPVVLTLGWWLMRRSLAPIDNLAARVNRMSAENIRQPIPRTGNSDEVDRLTEAFNAMAARLDGSFQQIREFTLHASHELKTPLTVMHAQLESALKSSRFCEFPPPCMTERTPDEPEAALHPWQLLNNHLDEIQRLTKIVDALIFLTKTDTGLVQLDRKPVPLAELLHESLEDALILGRSKNLEVTLAACEDTVVTGDRHRLRQLLLILTDNAVKYNQPDGKLSLSLRRSGTGAEIEVSNSGEGIPAGMESRIFNRFFRGENQEIEGCGLGLNIAQWIVHEHGGTIGVHSIPGKLTTMKVSIPAAVDS
jgi:signal transduction histidine kinase